MYALSDPAKLKGIYAEAGFQNVSVEPFPTPRRFRSAADIVANVRRGAGDLHVFLNRLGEADRDKAWTKIEEEFRRFEGPSALEIPGEVLICVGTR